MRELQSCDWRRIGVQLAAYAAWKAANFRWRTGRNDALAKGATPESVAAAAIEKVLAGERRWDPARGPLLPLLKRVVDSLLDHLAQSADNRLLERLPDAGDDPHGQDRAEHQGPRFDVAGLMPRPTPDPERVLLGHEQSSPEERLESVLAGVRGDEELAAVLRCVLEHEETKPSAIARCLGVDVKDIYNRVKRLRRLALAGAAPRAARARRAL